MKMENPFILLALIVYFVALSPTEGAVGRTPFNVKGIIPAVLTPVYDDGKINFDIISQYAQYLKDNDIDGVQVASTTGEGPSLTVRDKKKLIDAWVKAARPLGLTLIVQVGGIPLPDAEELAKYSEKVGVDAIMCLPELYYKAKNPEELVYFLQFISKAAPNTPLLYTDLAAYSGVNVNMVQFFELATRRIPNFKGIETGDFNTALSLQKYLERDQRIFIGDSPYLAPAALMGFDSFTNPEANVFPKLVIDIVNNGRRGNLRRTRSQFLRLRNLRELVVGQGNRPISSLNNQLAALKATMTLVTGIHVGSVLPPIRPLSDDQQSSLQDALNENDVETYDSTSC